jgi:hypothetical protein
MIDIWDTTLMYIFGSAVFTAGCVPFVIVTWPKTLWQWFPLNFERDAQLFWGSVYFIVGAYNP